jgi:hypothetical protein
MAITFQSGGTTVTPRSYGYPVEITRRRVQAQQELAAGALRVQDAGTEIAQWTLTWSAIAQSDHDALLAFWRLVAGAKTPFSFTDHSGVAHTVRWTNGWACSEIGYQIYKLTIMLREEIAG